MFEGGDLDEGSDFAAWGDGDFEVRDFDAHESVAVFGGAESVDIFHGGEVAHIDDEVEAFFDAHGADAVDEGDIDDAEAADFHVEAAEFFSGADDFASAWGAEDDLVVGDEGGTALEEAEGGFAFTDAAVALDENADAFDVDHAAVFAGDGCEFPFEPMGAGVDELHGVHGAAEDGDADVAGGVEEWRGELAGAAEDDAGDFAFAHAAEDPALFGFAETGEVGEFGIAEDLDAFVGEVEVEASEGEAWAVDGGLVDGAVHGAACVFEFEVEVFGVSGEEVGDGELAGLADAGAAFDDDWVGDGVHGGGEMVCGGRGCQRKNGDGGA